MPTTETDPTTPTDAPLQQEKVWKNGSLCDELVVLDVRTPAEFREVHVPGSTNLPLGDLERRAQEIRELAAARPVLLVCRTGRRAESARAELSRKGLAGVRVLEGGLAAWVDAGLPVNRGRRALSVERQVRMVAGTLVVLGVLLGLFVHPVLFGLSAFVGLGLVYAGFTDSCPMALTLAKMPWNRAHPTCVVAE